MNEKDELDQLMRGLVEFPIILYYIYIHGIIILYYIYIYMV